MIKFDLRNKKFKKFSAFFLALGLSAGSCFLSNSKIHADPLQVNATIINNYDGSVTLNFTKKFDDHGKFMAALKAGTTDTTKRLTDFFTQNFKVFVDPTDPANLDYNLADNVLEFKVSTNYAQSFSSFPLSDLAVSELTTGLAPGESGISVSMTVRDGLNITVSGTSVLSYSFIPKEFYIVENDWSDGYYKPTTNVMKFE